MSGYKRFITYLFRYEDGQKKEQQGYAKVQLRQNTGRIEIHLKNCKKELVEVRPYFFVGDVRVPIGSILVKNCVAEGVFRFEESKLKEMDISFQDIRGVVIPYGDREVIFSQWDDREYSWEEIGQVGRYAKGENISGKYVETQKMGAPIVEITESDHEVSIVEDSAEKPFRMDRLKALRPLMYPFEGDIHTWAVQAQLRDLKYLPEDYWNLSNNSFVMRGYFNYGNILIGWMAEKEKWFVGIPGVFCRQEKVIAGMFGFLLFRSKNGKEGSPGEFGYWYQLLDVVS